MGRLGYISVADTIRLLEAGLPVYVVSAPPETQALPLEGAWVDENGRVHYDCSCVCINPETAHKIGKQFNQQCILRLYPCEGGSEVYLFKDNPFIRQIALQYAGGYTADGEWLFTAISADSSPFENAYEECIPVEMEFIPVK